MTRHKILRDLWSILQHVPRDVVAGRFEFRENSWNEVDETAKLNFGILNRYVKMSSN